jgi:hypothetical protein
MGDRMHPERHRAGWEAGGGGVETYATGLAPRSRLAGVPRSGTRRAREKPSDGDTRWRPAAVRLCAGSPVASVAYG